MNIELPVEMEQVVLQQVANGRYSSATEMVCQALRLLTGPGARIDPRWRTRTPRFNLRRKPPLIARDASSSADVAPRKQA